jgi:hypothetical protein
MLDFVADELVAPPLPGVAGPTVLFVPEAPPAATLPPVPDAIGVEFGPVADPPDAVEPGFVSESEHPERMKPEVIERIRRRDFVVRIGRLDLRTLQTGAPS